MGLMERGHEEGVWGTRNIHCLIEAVAPWVYRYL